MNPLKYISALFGVNDVDVFWLAREEVLNKPGNHIFCNFLFKIIRKHYCSGIPVLPEINRFSTPHGFYGIFISQKAKIGNGCVIYQQVTIGSSDLQNSKGAPTIGDNCLIGTGAKIIGNVHVGNNVRIGANAIVVDDVPDNCTVVMNKPRIIMRGTY
ncbi:MAG: serine acetyltransferase [Aeriscardovia sp.]|nr:serine acetyltransferase [Aeriscardovia sp.]